MSYLIQKLSARSTISALALLCFCVLHANSNQISSSPPSAKTFYLDCSATQNGAGTRISPWNSLVTVNAFTFRAGDHLLLKRGAACNGVLAPQGSGAVNAPIVIDAYATGAQPIINGGSAEAALRLFNQQYWEVNNLEITGGHLYGVYVSGDIPNSSLNHIYLRNLDAHGATYTAIKRSDSGEVFFSTKAANQIFNDVLIDGVTAHDSHVSQGIFVNAGGTWIEGNGVSQPLGSNVTVQNSTAHDVYGDGILITEVKNGLLQGNVVYRSGLCPTCTGSTPVGLWQWYCYSCTVQNNESYANQSWGGDGGDFDIDYYSKDNVVQYNYGHDSEGYCVAIFGAGGRATLNSVFRYNVCSNNGRKSDLSKQGEVFVHTWDGGSLDGVQIYNNTFYWNPASSAAAIITTDATYTGSLPRFIKNNIIYATVPDMIETTSAFVLDNNIYWETSPSAPKWRFDDKTYTSFGAYQATTKQDIHSYYTDPMLSTPNYHGVGKPNTAFNLLPGSPAIGKGTNVCSGMPGCSIGAQDFWGHHLGADRAYNIGAYQEQ